jgi:quercetin dioxygenase-like cupin family protein
MIMATKKSVNILIFVGTMITVTLVMGFALVTGLGTATAQQAAPTETKGVTPTVLATVDLGSEIPGMQGRQLRLRIVTFEPGGVMQVHSHKDRPEVAYVLNGTVTEHRGDVAKEYRAGDSWAIGNVTHWIENKGIIPAVVISTDIFQP